MEILINKCNNMIFIIVFNKFKLLINPEDYRKLFCSMYDCYLNILFNN